MDWHDFQLAANHFLQLESHDPCGCRHNKFHLSGASSAGRDATCPSSIPSFSQAIIPNITISQQWFCALLTWLWRSMIVVLWERRAVSFAGLAFCLPSISFRLFNWGGLPSISLLSLDGGFIMFHHSSIHSKVVLHNYIHIYIQHVLEGTQMFQMILGDQRTSRTHPLKFSTRDRAPESDDPKSSRTQTYPKPLQ